MRKVAGFLVLGALVGCTVQSGSSGPGSSSGGSSSGGPIAVSSEPSSAPASLCQDRSIVLSGDGGARATSTRTSKSYSLGSGFRAEGSDDTFVLVSGKEPLSNGSSLFGPALFRAALGSGAPSLFCASADSVVTRDDTSTDRVSLRGVAALAECAAGTPVDGSVTICGTNRSRGVLCPKRELTGTLGGVSVSAPFGGYGRTDTRWTPSLGRAGYATVDLQGERVTGATFFVTDQADSAVFCATAGTMTSEGEGADAETKIELTGIRRLGGCPRGGATVVEGCVK
jgi:hypothetical protein